MPNDSKITEILKSEDIAILDYNLGADEGIVDHDEVCIAQATKLLQIGYLEYETAVYGSAYCTKDGKINYYLSVKEDTMDKFQHNCFQQNIYPTPAKYFFKRYDLVSDTEDEIKSRFRISTALSLKQSYPPIIFEAFQSLTSNDCANSAFTIMQELCAQLDSCFDLNQLHLFGDLTEMLFRGRLLTKESYILLNQWLSKEYEKISVETIASGDYRRTYSGFAYKMPSGKISYFVDAFPYMAREKHISFIAKGYIVTPILSITYYADSFNNLQKNSREKFLSELQKYAGEMYIKLMELLRELPAGVDSDLYLSYYEKIQATGSKQAIETFLYYGYLWNVKF